MREIIKYKPINKREFARKAKVIYETIRDEMEANYMGKIVAIDPETGDYFIGNSGIEAGDKAREKYPDKNIYKATLSGHTGTYGEATEQLRQAKKDIEEMLTGEGEE